ncbi:TerD family protein [Streptomyces sp. MST-110588]|uniref:TerD family protein n=1 Tax=Streptomyces sp. MST-110588 TaxID=2833628 RepID=UPI001F5D62A8|nr:TerD family protein [Streptomyces sp. MST-110588]UNO39581.1 TerD family protein [Streptomyces sp. MST-110588]
MSSLSKGIRKAEVALKWDSSPLGTPAHDLDLVAATYTSDAPYGPFAYLVYFDQRSPDGTIALNRDSRTGLGLGTDEVMTLELDRLAPDYVRVVVGVTVQQRDGRRTFGDVARTGVRVLEGPEVLAEDDLADVADATAATVAEFTRNDAGVWRFRKLLRGFDTDPAGFADLMGSPEP